MKSRFRLQSVSVAAFLMCGLLFTHAADGKAKAAPPKVRPYTLRICIVTGQKLEADAYTFKYEGREIKTCCDQCMDDFYKDPATYVSKIEAAEKKAQPKKKK